MVTKDGALKILDFGLAKLLKEQSDQVTNAPTAQATQAGTVMGTIGYMSPEQASGRPLDYRTDQFSMGSILYEMATGKRAFQRGTTRGDADGDHPRGHRAGRAAQRRRAGAVPLDRRALPAEGPRGALRLDPGPRAGRARGARAPLGGLDHGRRVGRDGRVGAPGRGVPGRHGCGVAAAVVAAFGAGVAGAEALRQDRRRPPSSRSPSAAARSRPRASLPTARRSSTAPPGTATRGSCSSSTRRAPSPCRWSFRARTSCRSRPPARWRSTSTAAARTPRVCAGTLRARGADGRRAARRGRGRPGRGLGRERLGPARRPGRRRQGPHRVPDRQGALRDDRLRQRREALPRRKAHRVDRPPVLAGRLGTGSPLLDLSDPKKKTITAALEQGRGPRLVAEGRRDLVHRDRHRAPTSPSMP